MLTDFYVRCEVTIGALTEKDFMNFIEDLRKVFAKVEEYKHDSAGDIVLFCQGDSGVAVFLCRRSTGFPRKLGETFEAWYIHKLPKDKARIELVHRVCELDGNREHREVLEVPVMKNSEEIEELLWSQLVEFVSRRVDTPYIIEFGEDMFLDVVVYEPYCGDLSKPKIKEQFVSLSYDIIAKSQGFSVEGELCLLLSARNPIDHEKLLRVLEKYRADIDLRILRSM